MQALALAESYALFAIKAGTPIFSMPLVDPHRGQCAGAGAYDSTPSKQEPPFSPRPSLPPTMCRCYHWRLWKLTPHPDPGFSRAASASRHKPQCPPLPSLPPHPQRPSCRRCHWHPLKARSLRWPVPRALDPAPMLSSGRRCLLAPGRECFGVATATLTAGCSSHRWSVRDGVSSPSEPALMRSSGRRCLLAPALRSCRRKHAGSDSRLFYRQMVSEGWRLVDLDLASMLSNSSRFFLAPDCGQSDCGGRYQLEPGHNNGFRSFVRVRGQLWGARASRGTGRGHGTSSQIPQACCMSQLRARMRCDGALHAKGGGMFLIKEGVERCLTHSREAVARGIQCTVWSASCCAAT